MYVERRWSFGGEIRAQQATTKTAGASVRRRAGWQHGIELSMGGAIENRAEWERDAEEGWRWQGQRPRGLGDGANNMRRGGCAIQPAWRRKPGSPATRSSAWGHDGPDQYSAAAPPAGTSDTIPRIQQAVLERPKLRWSVTAGATRAGERCLAACARNTGSSTLGDLATSHACAPPPASRIKSCQQA
jgi:hypothetical protein